MISHLNFSKEHDSIKNIDGVRVLNLCTSSDDALYLYQVSRKYLKRFQSYSANTISLLKFSKGHNSIKNVDGVTPLNLCISSDDALYLYQLS